MSKPELDTDKLASYGLKFTKIYLVLLLGGPPVLAYFDLIEFAPLQLNELGDFLAGAFGPLAIFWLVLGFFQQGKELKNSVATLELQARELANSVEQQRELVQVTREQLAHERSILESRENARKKAIQPVFSVLVSGGTGTGEPHGDFNNDVIVTNLGAAATNVSVEIQPPPFACNFPRTEYWETGKEIRFEVRFLEKGPAKEATMNIRYQDSDQDDHTASFRLSPSEKGPFHMHVTKEC